MVALAHGTSDGQKTMGVITLVLIAANLHAKRHWAAAVGDHRRRSGHWPGHVLGWMAHHAHDG